MAYKIIQLIVIVILEIRLFLAKQIKKTTKIILLIVGVLVITSSFYISPSIRVSHFLERFQSPKITCDYKKVGSKYLLVDEPLKDPETSSAYRFYMYNRFLGFYFYSSRPKMCQMINLGDKNDRIMLFKIQIDDYYAFFCGDLNGNEVKLVTNEGEVKLVEREILVIKQEDFDSHSYILNDEITNYGLWVYEFVMAN